MNDRQIRALSLRDTDINGAVRRFCNNEDLYISCLRVFPEDQTIRELNQSIKDLSWDDAFTAAHALKGLAGNMGFVPLMHSTSQLVVLIRGGRLKEINECMAQINSSYRDILDAITECFISDDEESKGE